MKRQIPPSIWNAENPHVSQMFPPKKNDHACDKKPSRCPLRLVWEELYLNTTFGATLSKTELLLRLCQDPSALRDDEDFSVFYPEKEIIQTIHHHHHHHYDRHRHQINQKRQPLQPPWLQLPYIRNPLP